MRLYAPGARLVSTRQVAGVVEAVGHTVAAWGIGCVYGDTGLGKTVAVEQALHLLPGRVPVWRAVVGVRSGLPQVRAALCEVLGLPSGLLQVPSTSSRPLLRTVVPHGEGDRTLVSGPLPRCRRRRWQAQLVTTARSDAPDSVPSA